MIYSPHVSFLLHIKLSSSSLYTKHLKDPKMLIAWVLVRLYFFLSSSPFPKLILSIAMDFYRGKIRIDGDITMFSDQKIWNRYLYCDW